MIKKVERDNNKFDLNIIDNNGNLFAIIFAGNQDLYWYSYLGVKEFEISKEDSDTYGALKLLLLNISKVDKYQQVMKDNEFNWICDFAQEEKANSIKIQDNDDSIKIIFNRNPQHFAPKNSTSICFCNSGSRHPRVVQQFMKMYLHEAYGYDYKEFELLD